MIAKEAQGFVYCVSSLGVTGMRSQITTDIGAMVEIYEGCCQGGLGFLVVFFYAGRNGAPARKLQTTAGNANLN